MSQGKSKKIFVLRIKSGSLHLICYISMRYDYSLKKETLKKSGRKEQALLFDSIKQGLSSNYEKRMW